MAFPRFSRYCNPIFEKPTKAPRKPFQHLRFFFFAFSAKDPYTFPTSAGSKPSFAFLVIFFIVGLTKVYTFWSFFLKHFFGGFLKQIQVKRSRFEGFQGPPVG